MRKRPSDQRTRQAMDLAAAILDSGTIDDLLQDMVPELSRFLGSETACGSEMYQDKGKPWLGRTATVNMGGHVMCRYNDDFLELDPIGGSAYSRAGRHRIRARTAQVMRMSDWLRSGDRGHGFFFNEFLRRERLDHVLGIIVRTSVETAPVLVFGFHRAGCHPDFGPEDFAMAQAILPALLARLDNFALQSEISALRGGAAAKSNFALELDIRDFGDQKVVMNPASRAKSIVYPGLLSRVETVLKGGGTASTAQGIMAALGLSSAHYDENIAVHFETAQRLRLEVAPSGRADPIAEWSLALGLSKREIDVLRCVTGGRRNAEIAEDLGLSIRTVENHLRSVFAKAGVSSRAQMIHKTLTETRGAL